MRQLSALALLALLSLAASAAAPPAKVPREWSGLIDELGDDDEDVRKAAGKKLLRLGEDALPFIRKAGRSHADPDVRLHAAALAEAIERAHAGEVRVFVGHTRGVSGFALSPDGKRMVSGSRSDWFKHRNEGSTEPVARVWDVETGKEVSQLKGGVCSADAVAWSKDGKRILTASDDGKIMLWDAGKARNLRTFSVKSTNTAGAAFAPDGKTAVCTYRLGIVLLHLGWFWSLERLEEQSADTGRGKILPDGKHFVTSHAEGEARLRDLRTGKTLRKLGATSCIALDVSPDGKTLAVGERDHTISLLDLETGKRRQKLSGHAGLAVAGAYSADGKRFISGGTDKKAVVWDVGSGKALRTFEGHEAVVTGVAFLPDGKRAVTSSLDKTLRLWRVRE